MAYTTLYDVSADSYLPWVGLVLALVLVTIGILNLHSKPPLIRRPFLTLIILAGFAVAIFVGLYSDYHRLATALRESRCEVVEGPLTQLQITLPTTAHIDESFVVAGQRFACSNYRATAGYSPSRTDGAPLRGFLPVRIHHLHGEIARFEIAAPNS